MLKNLIKTTNNNKRKYINISKRIKFLDRVNYWVTGEIHEESDN